MVSLSDAMLLEEVSRAGSGEGEEEGVRDTRLIEQPDSASVASTMESAVRGGGREAPEENKGTGMAIMQTLTRPCRIGSPPRRKKQPPKRQRGP